MASSYLLAGMTIPGVERDLKRVVKGLHRRYTNEAADRLGEFPRPALIAWSREDRFFKPAHAERLAQELPNARLEDRERPLLLARGRAGSPRRADRELRPGAAMTARRGRAAAAHR